MSKIKNLSIEFTIALIFFAFTIIYLIFKKMKKNSLLDTLVPFIQKWEGGLSRDPADTASKFPIPVAYNGKTGYHTNKGITYLTFKSLASKAGYVASPENFFSMPNTIWLKILKIGYMKAYPLEKLDKYPSIQAVIISWAWGSGVSGAERYLANFQRDKMKIKDSDITPTEIVENFKNFLTPQNEKYLFNLLCDRRAEDFAKMKTFPQHGNGWLNRLSQFRKLYN